MNSKEEKIKAFDPSGSAGSKTNIFGLPFSESEADIVIVPMPWEVTVSYQSGTAKGPESIFAASKQVDLYDADVADAWQRGIFMREADKSISKFSKSLRKKAVKYLQHYENGKLNQEMLASCEEINSAGRFVKDYLKKEMSALLEKKKLPAMLGGDHSTPLGFMEAIAEKYSGFGILQIDAHCDLRNAYEGFEYSHASIMFNALKIPEVKKLVQVGIRDFCEEEINVTNSSNGRVKTFFDADLKRKMFEGENWKSICNQIVNELPNEIYISFGIDGLDPKLCPHTGTPVPGGLEFEQAVYLLKSVVDSGRKIIGIDLNEVAPGNDEWDANVGVRLLYKMCNLMGKSNLHNI